MGAEKENMWVKVEHASTPKARARVCSIVPVFKTSDTSGTVLHEVSTVGLRPRVAQTAQASKAGQASASKHRVWQGGRAWAQIATRYTTSHYTSGRILPRVQSLV